MVVREAGFDFALARILAFVKLVYRAPNVMRRILQAHAYVRRNGVDALFWRKVRRVLAGKSSIASSLADPMSEVFGYAGRETAPFSIGRLAVGVSSGGNFFMHEIACLIASGFEESGVRVDLFDEKSIPAAGSQEWVIVVAPHEFFLLDCPVNAFAKLRRHRRLAMVNTEQLQTPWFERALKYIRRADLVLDISFQSAIRLRFNGFPVRFIPLGYSERYQTRFSGRHLARRGPTEGLRPSVIHNPPAEFADRPIDILFIGTESPRRREFFAKNAPFFSAFSCFIYLPSGQAPFMRDSPATLDFQHCIGLAQRAKIVLNIHRDAERYLEWQRIVNIGIFSGACVISDSCESNPLLLAGRHYLDVPLEAVTDACARMLSDPHRAAGFASSAREDLVRGAPIKDFLRRVLAGI